MNFLLSAGEQKTPLFWYVSKLNWTLKCQLPGWREIRNQSLVEHLLQFTGLFKNPRQNFQFRYSIFSLQVFIGSFLDLKFFFFLSFFYVNAYFSVLGINKIVVFKWKNK